MKKQIYELFVDIWRLACKYQFHRLSDSEWEAFVKDGAKLCRRHRKNGPAVEWLCRDLFGNIQSFYEKGLDNEKCEK